MVYKPRATGMAAPNVAKAYATHSLRTVYTYTLWYV
jgi:hypothetical protein